MKKMLSTVFVFAMSTITAHASGETYDTNARPGMSITEYMQNHLHDKAQGLIDDLTKIGSRRNPADIETVKLFASTSGWSLRNVYALAPTVNSFLGGRFTLSVENELNTATVPAQKTYALPLKVKEGRRVVPSRPGTLVVQCEIGIKVYEGFDIARGYAGTPLINKSHCLIVDITLPQTL